jgi:hypothetical protein
MARGGLHRGTGHTGCIVAPAWARKPRQRHFASLTPQPNMITIDSSLKPSRRCIASMPAALWSLCAFILSPVAAEAAYYNTYTTAATLDNPNGCYATQGFDAGSSYTYSIKISSDNTKASIYRTAMSDGTTTLMTNGDNGTTYTTYLGHANDLTLKTINSEYYMFIVTMNTGSLSLVKLKYVGTTYYKVGNYTLQYNGSNVSMSGVKDTGADASNIYFLFKSGRTYYRGTLPLTANSGTITLSYGFYINTEDALVNGSTVSDIATYTNQGFGYSAAKDRIYHPLTKDNVSIVLVYNNVSTASGTITADPNLSFRITSGTYSYLFEIESCAIGLNGHLWFNTNRKTDSSDTAHDGVHYFDGFVE